MTFEEIKKLLGECVREEVVDYTFGDAEVCWYKGTIQVAFGYFGRSCSDVSSSTWCVSGPEAHILRNCGIFGSYTRNDGG